MKNRTILIVTLSIIGLLSAPGVRAQPGPPGAGRGAGGPYNRIYDPKTVETVRGEVLKVESAAPMGAGMGRGVHLLLKTDNETLSVHLGPAWFIDNQETRIQPRDQVQVTGSRVTLDGRPALIASEVKDGGAVLKLREENGVPVWAGWRHGAAGAAAGPGGMMAGRGMMSTNMVQRRQQMMQEHQNMMAEMKAMDADLDKKVAQMNQAQGSAKVDAMAAVINDLLKERQLMHQRMEAMHQYMMSRMGPLQSPMGGSEEGTGNDSSGSGAPPGKE